MKMVFAIVNKDDSGVVSEALTQEGFFVTKSATKGGFLSAGNTTLITGTDDDKVDQVIQIIEEHSKSRKELVSIGSIGTATYSPFPVEVTVGGATIFVLPVERFEKV